MAFRWEDYHLYDFGRGARVGRPAHAAQPRARPDQPSAGLRCWRARLSGRGRRSEPLR
ncbi:hypothetical protein [Methylobacterium sp. R2-1]|uniref:hypothetical protein n=1 Tax=Methylobacterium sp. R2-1 TaxID=2587064 RepID=UPI0039184855